jgi:hypothetical protein
MLQCYVLMCGRSVTAFWRPLEVSARGKGPARPTQRPALVAVFVPQWLRHCTTNRKVAGSIPYGVTGIFHFRPHYGPGVDSPSKRNEYQEYFLEINAAGA